MGMSKAAHVAPDVGHEPSAAPYSGPPEKAPRDVEAATGAPAAPDDGPEPPAEPKCGSPESVPRDMRAALLRAKAEGRRDRLRVQAPCIAMGIALFALGTAARFAVSRMVVSVGVCAQTLGVTLFYLAILPSQERLAWIVSGAVVATGVINVGSSVLTIILPRSGLIPLLAQCGRLGSPLPRLVCREALLDVVLPLLLVLLMLHWVVAVVHASWREEKADRAILEAFWRALARLYGCTSALLVVRFIISSHGEGSRPDAGILVLGIWLALLTAAIVHPTLRVRVQSALAARGEALLTAATVAAFIGNADATDLITRAQDSFRAVPLSAVMQEHFETNAPDSDLFSLSVPVVLGQCDAFISHSWTDEPCAKYEALRAWGCRFEDKYRRTPLVWIDRFCLQQDELSDEVQLLPCYLAGCTSLLALAGGTYLSRLWCIVEIFVFVCMGAPADAIEVALLADDLPIDTFDTMQARCFSPSDQQRLLGTVEASAGGVDEFNRYMRAILADATSHATKSAPLGHHLR